MKNFCLTTGALAALTAILLGAFGTHVLRSHLDPASIIIYETAVKYQIYHAFALILTGIVSFFIPGRLPLITGWFFLGGIILFSGSLYVLCFTGYHPVGFITPIGGILFIAGWLSFVKMSLSKSSISR